MLRLASQDIDQGLAHYPGPSGNCNNDHGENKVQRIVDWKVDGKVDLWEGALVFIGRKRRALCLPNRPDFSQIPACTSHALQVFSY